MIDPIQLTIPDVLMRAIELVIKDPETTPVRKLEAALMITFGYAAWQMQNEIKPGDVRIPEEQWHKISDLFRDIPGSDIARVNYVLDWVNLAPGTYAPTRRVQA